jgi:hypothetical protein
MLLVAVCQFIVTCWMPRRKADHQPTALEAAEAIVG